MMRPFVTGISLAVAGLLAGGQPGLHAAENEAQAARIGDRFEVSSLETTGGAEWGLEEVREAELLVVAFVGTECPLAKLYSERLGGLAKSYDQRVAWVFVDPNSQDSLAEMAAFAKQLSLPGPLLRDVAAKTAIAWNVERTPEVLVFDRERALRYRGRVDDQFGIGYVKDEATSQDLKQAVDALLAGDAVATPVTEAAGCLIGKPREPDPNADVTFANQISRIFNRRCVECHREGEIGPFALTEYEEAAGWADMILETVDSRRMPPWHADPAHGEFKNDRRLSDEELSQIRAWVKAGAPQGDPALQEAPPETVAGWQLPKEPDLVLKMADEPFVVPATGEVKYRWFEVDPGFTEDKWVQAIEVRPGNRAVVHHILVFDKGKNGWRRDFAGGARGYLAGYVPGLRIDAYPEGMAKKIEAGSTIRFQIHYTPIGKEQTDLSDVGFVFADPKTVKKEVKTVSVVQPGLRIPPGEDDYRVSAFKVGALRNSELLCLMPHMHLRGKSFRYEARYPDGTTEVLLDVPQYDFNWQTAYMLPAPRKLPDGTRIWAEAAYDNSANNPANPAPDEWVRWGDQTWEEMMIGYFDIAVPLDDGTEELPIEQVLSKEEKAAMLLGRLDKNGDKALVKEEVPEKYRFMVELLDYDKSGSVDQKELEKIIDKVPIQ